MAPNRFDVIEQLARVLQPNLRDSAVGSLFTRRVAATLHYGSLSLGIVGDVNWGLKRNPSGLISSDVIKYRSSGEAFDICVSMGSTDPNVVPQLAWNATDTAGQPWVQPDAADVVAGPGEPPPPPPPSPPTDTIASQIRDAVLDIRDLLRRAAARFGL